MVGAMLAVLVAEPAPVEVRERDLTAVLPPRGARGGINGCHEHLLPPRLPKLLRASAARLRNNQRQDGARASALKSRLAQYIDMTRIRPDTGGCHGGWRI
eukprot:6399988-Pyramimonas_sp.AAC.1